MNTVGANQKPLAKLSPSGRPPPMTSVRPGMAILRDETFGPVSPILPVATLDEALSQANDTRYGLSA